MTFLDVLLSAFPIDPIPKEYISSPEIFSDSNSDAMSFIGKRWTELDDRHWENNGDAIFAFPPKTFNYYLPSLMNIGMNNEFRDLNSWKIFQILNTSGSPDIWDKFFTDRIVALNLDQISCLRVWADHAVRAMEGVTSEDSERVIFTILVAEEEIAISATGAKNP